MNIKIKNPIIQIASGSEFKKINIKIFKKLNLYGIIAEKQFIPKNMNFKGKLLESDSVALNPVLLSGLAVLKNNFKKLNFAFFDGNPQSKKDRIDTYNRSLSEWLKTDFKYKIESKNMFKSKKFQPSKMFTFHSSGMESSSSLANNDKQ